MTELSRSVISQNLHILSTRHLQNQSNKIIVTRIKHRECDLLTILSRKKNLENPKYQN